MVENTRVGEFIFYIDILRKKIYRKKILFCRENGNKYKEFVLQAMISARNDACHPAPQSPSRPAAKRFVVSRKGKKITAEGGEAAESEGVTENKVVEKHGGTRFYVVG